MVAPIAWELVALGFWLMVAFRGGADLVLVVLLVVIIITATLFFPLSSAFIAAARQQTGDGSLSLSVLCRSQHLPIETHAHTSSHNLYLSPQSLGPYN